MFDEARFQELRDVWSRETMHLSSVSEMVKHPAYLEIIAMGPEVVPSLIQTLRERQGHWFTALREITGENPVKSDHMGRVNLMAQDWIEWWESGSLVWWMRANSHKFEYDPGKESHQTGLGK